MRQIEPLAQVNPNSLEELHRSLPPQSAATIICFSAARISCLSCAIVIRRADGASTNIAMKTVKNALQRMREWFEVNHIYLDICASKS